MDHAKRERPVKDLDDAAMGVYPIWTKEGTIQREKTEKETDLLRILLTLPWVYTQSGQSKAPYRKRNKPVEDLADAAMRHLQLSADFTRPDPLQCQLQDLKAEVIWQRPAVSELPSILVDVAST